MSPHDREGEAERVAEPSLEPVIVTVSPPRLHITKEGDISEEDAALYLSYRMRRSISVRALQRWRTDKIGPVYHKVPGGKAVWYRVPDLDEWIALSCAVDPLAA